MKKENRERVRFVKSELDNYYHLKDRAVQNNFRAYELQARIDKVSSGSPSKIPIANSEFNPHWRSPLFDELEYIEKEIDNDLYRVARVDEFLSKLDTEEREMITRLHLSRNDKRTYISYCLEVYMDRKTLYRHIAKIILDNWLWTE